MNKTFKKYRIIGDQHGRSNWKKLVEPFDKDTMYIFVGDYTDPYYYENITYDQMVTELLKILQFKKEHGNNVSLLIGNHDMQYIINQGDTNRYDFEHANTLHTIFIEKKDFFSGVAFQIGEKYLITHAGVTLDWYQKWIDYKKDDTTLEKICKQINKLWEENKKAFTFKSNVTKFSDCYGESSTHSPLWIRPTSLWEHNLFGFGSGKTQIVGHTRFEHYKAEYEHLIDKIAAVTTIKEDPDERVIDYGLDNFINDGVKLCTPIYSDYFDTPDIIQIDCLEKETACVEIDGETLKWQKIIK